MTAMPDLTLSIDALIRSIQINRAIPHGLFLGAGASITSGVPSAATCIWEWKRQIFLTKNPGLDDQFCDLSLPSVQQRIQRWLDDERAYPPQGCREEYSRYAALCYPLVDDRRQYFQERSVASKPYLGYRLLVLLGAAGIVTTAWTTNFDSLLARTATADGGVTPIEVGLDPHYS
jgi:hypothetical protein